MVSLTPRQTIIVAILIFFLGKFINRKVAFFRNYNIPEPVTGGILASIFFWVLYGVFGLKIEFHLFTRDILLLVFFTTIGLSARFSTLKEGGIALVTLLVAAVTYLFLQNIAGVTVARVMDLNGIIGLLGGSLSLSGGHGTTIAWAPKLVTEYGISNAMEIGVACATFGLVLGGLITNDKTLQVNGVPVLKEIPLIKYLFSSKEEVTSRKELVFVITPHIINLKKKKTLRDLGFGKLQ
jgi:ESS family glutamate:Na+ symporter